MMTNLTQAVTDAVSEAVPDSAPVGSPEGAPDGVARAKPEPPDAELSEQGEYLVRRIVEGVSKALMEARGGDAEDDDDDAAGNVTKRRRRKAAVAAPEPKRSWLRPFLAIGRGK